MKKKAELPMEYIIIFIIAIVVLIFMILLSAGVREAILNNIKALFEVFL